MNPYYREHLISACLSFLAGFSTELLTSLNNITLESFKDGAIWGLLFVAVRQGFKVTLELFIAWHAKSRQ